MKRIIAGLFITLDGVTEAPERWQFQFENNETNRLLAEQLAQCDTALFGARTYELFAQFWPSAPMDLPPAKFFNTFPKFVVSNTLREPSWAGTSVISGDVIGAVRELKAGPGTNIQLTGSATLVRSLLAAGLIDELRLLVSPVTVGSGARLFDGLDPSVSLTATSAAALSNGVVHVVYTPSAPVS